MQPFKKESEVLAKTVKRYSVAFVIIALFTLSYLLLKSTGNPDPSSSGYENQVQAIVMSFRLKIAALIALVTLGFTYLSAYVLTHSKLVKWFTHWSKGDSETVRSSKIRGMAILFGSLLVTMGLIFSSVLK